MLHPSNQPFTDRREAGVELAAKLTRYANRFDVGCWRCRGGGPVAFEVARALDADLDIFLVRKIGMPGHANTRPARSPSAACAR